MHNFFRKFFVRLRCLSPANLWRAIANRRFLQAVKSVVVRSYALLILSLLLAAGYLSVHYLVKTVFYPPTLPRAMSDWASKLDVAELRSNHAEGVERSAPRAPISHYHTVEQWFQPDTRNGCTISGCHQPLPHDHRAKVAAFANFHATFLTCQMCHAPAAARPATARWVSTTTGLVQDSPAILQLMKFIELNTDAIATYPETVDRQIKQLLATAITSLGQDQVLDELLAEMQSSQPGSPVWKQAEANLVLELPLHARGEYGAKLAWTGDAAATESQFATLTAQARSFLAMPSDSPDRAALQKTIHQPLAGAATACVACHDDQPALLDFQSAGYSPKRALTLAHLEIARLMQQVREGQSFYIPSMGEEAR
jgi:hypothetical protein